MKRKKQFRQPGAGRPPKDQADKFVRLTVRLLPADIKRVEKADGTVQNYLRRKVREDWPDGRT